MNEWMNEWMNVCSLCTTLYSQSNSAYISNCHVTWMNEWENEWMSECLFGVYYIIISV